MVGLSTRLQPQPSEFMSVLQEALAGFNANQKKFQESVTNKVSDLSQDIKQQLDECKKLAVQVGQQGQAQAHLLDHVQPDRVQASRPPRLVDPWQGAFMRDGQAANVGDIVNSKKQVAKLLREEQSDTIAACLAYVLAQSRGLNGNIYGTVPKEDVLAFNIETSEESISIDIIAFLEDQLCKKWTQVMAITSLAAEPPHQAFHDVALQAVSEVFVDEFKVRVHAKPNGFQFQWAGSGLRQRILASHGCRLLRLRGEETEDVQVSYDDEDTAALPPGVLRSQDVSWSVVLVLHPADYRDDGADSVEYTEEFWELIEGMQNSFWPLAWIGCGTLENAKRDVQVRDEVVMMTPAQVGVVDGMVNSMVLRDSFKTTDKYGEIPPEPDAEINSWKDAWKTGRQGQSAKRTMFLMTQAVNRARDRTEQPGPSLCSDFLYRTVWLKCAEESAAHVILDFARQSAGGDERGAP